MTPLELQSDDPIPQLADLERTLQIWEECPPDFTIEAFQAVRAKIAEIRTGMMSARKISTENVVAFGHDPFEQDTRIL